MALTKTNLRMMDTGFITPLDFGAIGDGATDDATALQNTLNASDYSVIDLAGKTYATTVQLTLTRSNVTIKNGTIKYTGTNKSKLSILKIGSSSPGFGSTLNPNAAVNIGEYVISFASASSFAIGDWVKIAHHTDNTDFISNYTDTSSVDSNPDLKTTFFSDMQKVTAVNSSDNDIVLLNPILGKLTTNSTVIEITNIYNNIRIESVTFKGHAIAEVAIDNNGFTNSSASVVTVNTAASAAHNLEVSDYVYFGGGTTASADFNYNDHVRGEQTITVDVDADTFQYSSGDIVHVASVGGATAVGVSGLNRALEIWYCSDVTVYNCNFEDCPGGIVELNYVNNCKIDSNTYAGPAYPDADIILLGNTTPYLTISNNTIFGGRGGNAVYSPSGHAARRGTTYEHTGGSYCLIKDNRFIGIRGVGIQLGATFVRAKIENNYITTATKFLTGLDDLGVSFYNRRNIVVAAFDTEILNNHLENVLSTGIQLINAITADDVLTGAIGDAVLGTDDNNYIPFYSFKIRGNRIYSSKQLRPDQGIEIYNEDSVRTADASQITDNIIYGFGKSIHFHVNAGTTMNNCVLTNNICIVTADSTSSVLATNIDVTGVSGARANAYRWAVNNNIFNIRGEAADFADAAAHNLDLFYLQFTRCSINSNIFSYSALSHADASHIRFNDPTATGVDQYVNKSIFIGNVFENGDSTSSLYDISLTQADSGEVGYTVGESLAAESADYGERYGLNVWSNISDSEWPGPD